MIDGLSVPKICFCLGPSNYISESCCILCMSATLKSQATRWSHQTHADHIVTRLSSKVNWVCVFFPQCDMRVKLSLDVSKFENGIEVDATSAALVPKTNPARCCWTRDLYVGNRRGKTQGWITQPKMGYSFENLYWQSPSDSDLSSTKVSKTKKKQGCTYPSLPAVVGRRLNLFRSTSLSPGDSRVPGPILGYLLSSSKSLKTFN